MLRMIALLMSIWGGLLMILGASSRLGLIPDPQGFGPTGLDRLGVFALAGGLLLILGGVLALFTIDDRRIKRRIARSCEWLSFTVGLSLLVFGIVTHHPKRDPWIVAGVASVLGISWIIRIWAGR